MTESAYCFIADVTERTPHLACVTLSASAANGAVKSGWQQQWPV